MLRVVIEYADGIAGRKYRWLLYEGDILIHTKGNFQSYEEALSNFRQETEYVIDFHSREA